jgi:single-stranded DNA-binding protein
MSASAIVSGILFKAPIEKASKAGNPFATFPIRENHNGATRWWQCITFNENEIESLKAMTPGEPISVAGEITAEIYAPVGSESRINWRITVDAVLSARKPPMAKPERTGRKSKEATGLDRAEASNTGGSALAAASWASSSPLMNDDIPFAPEWR